MATRQRLTAKFVAAVEKPGAYGDGGHGSHGLILRVREAKGGGRDQIVGSTAHHQRQAHPHWAGAHLARNALARPSVAG